jgi:hypothetical protein
MCESKAVLWLQRRCPGPRLRQTGAEFVDFRDKASIDLLGVRRDEHGVAQDAGQFRQALIEVRKLCRSAGGNEVVLD